jgi:hypothetical protein
LTQQVEASGTSKKAEQALSLVLQGLPDGMTEEQVEASTGVFLDMEKSILKHNLSEYRGFMSGVEAEQAYEILYPVDNCGTDFI